jgi:hypothetical protein
MPSLNEIRQKYPQYNDMNDQEFADKFHDKFYSDIPKDEFYKKIGLSSEENQGESLLQKSGGMAQKYINEPVEDIGRQALNLGAGAGQGLANVGAGTRNVLAKGANLIPGVNIPMAKEVDIVPHGLASSAGQFGGSMVGGGQVLKSIEHIPKVGNAILEISKMLGKSSKNINKIISAAEDIGKGALAGATISPENQGTGALLGGAGTAAGQAIGKAVPFLKEELKPTNLSARAFPAKHLSEKELLSNLEIAGKGKTSLGSVLEDPFLSRQYENVLSKVPLSGAPQKMQEAAGEVVGHGKNALKKMLGENNPENVSQQVSETLMKEFKRHQKEKSGLYKNVDELSEKNNLKPDLSGFAKTAKSYRSAIDSSNILKNEPDVAKVFKKLGSYINPVKESQLKTGVNKGSLRSDVITGEPIVKKQYPTLKEANLLKGKLNQYAQTASKSPDPSQRSLASVYGNLAKSLKSDIQKSIESSGNAEIKNAYKSAEENYKKHFSPFLDRDIYKHISGQKDADMIVADFLKTSKSTDRSNKLLKLTSKLPDKEQKLIGYSYFSRALDNEGNLEPHKLNSLIKNLGKRQFKALIPDESLRNELLNFSKLYKMNIKGVDLLKNPPTGQQALDLLPSLMAHAGSSYAGGLLGGLPGAIAGVAAPGLISRPIVNALTSPKFREKTVNAILKKRAKAKSAEGKK